MSNDAIVIDLSNYKDRTGSRVTPGVYRVTVEDVEMTESNAKNPMINLWFTILDAGEFKGQTLIDRLVLTEKSLFRVVGFMQAIGMPTPKKSIKLNPRQFVGKTLDVTIDDGEPYNGRIRSEVKGYDRIPQSAANTDVFANDEDEVTPQASPPADLENQVSSEPETVEAPEGTTTQSPESSEAKAATVATEAAAPADDADGDLDLDSVQL